VDRADALYVMRTEVVDAWGTKTAGGSVMLIPMLVYPGALTDQGKFDEAWVARDAGFLATGVFSLR
jgi:hypothetical protein